MRLHFGAPVIERRGNCDRHTHLTIWFTITIPSVSAVGGCAAFAIRHPPSAICHPPSAIRHPRRGICHQRSRDPPSAKPPSGEASFHHHMRLLPIRAHVRCVHRVA